MGSGGSKPEQYVFNPNAPVQFSQSVINGFQHSSDTDSSRARNDELKLQKRVEAELKRLRDEGAKRVSDLTDSLTVNPPKDGTTESKRDPNTLAYHLSSPFYHDSSTGAGSGSKADSGRSHDSVQKEIADLKSKLDSRKKVEKPSPELEKARSEVVKCLRANDRRPLDCWQEVENFKAEVRKLEQAFITKTGGR